MYWNEYRTLFLGHVAWPEGIPWRVSPEQEKAGYIAGFSTCSLCRLAAALGLVLSTQIQSCFGSVYWRPLMAQQVKNPPAMQETQVPSLGQEGPSAGGNGNSLRYSCLKNPMDKGAWWATVQRVAKCRTWLSEKTHTYWGPRPIIIAQNTCY